MDDRTPIELNPALGAASFSLFRRYRLLSAAGLLLAVLVAAWVH